MTGLRADYFCDILFFYHAYVKLRSETYTILIVVDVALTFTTTFAPRTMDIHETVQRLMEWMDSFNCIPKHACAYVVVQSFERQKFFRYVDIEPFSTGPYTPWPNRVEASVRALKANLQVCCDKIGT